MRETFNVPEDDQFMTITEHDGDNFRYSASYLGVARSDDLVLVQLTVSNTRSLEQKKALFSRIAELLVESPGLRPEDVFVNLVEVDKENWSMRSEEHTSELQSQSNLVCRLLLEKKKIDQHVIGLSSHHG